MTLRKASTKAAAASDDAAVLAVVERLALEAAEDSGLAELESAAKEAEATQEKPGGAA